MAFTKEYFIRNTEILGVLFEFLDSCYKGFRDKYKVIKHPIYEIVFV